MPKRKNYDVQSVENVLEVFGGNIVRKSIEIASGKSVQFQIPVPYTIALEHIRMTADHFHGTVTPASSGKRLNVVYEITPSVKKTAIKLDDSTIINADKIVKNIFKPCVIDNDVPERTQNELSALFKTVLLQFCDYKNFECKTQDNVKFMLSFTLGSVCINEIDDVLSKTNNQIVDVHLSYKTEKEVKVSMVILV